MTTGDSFTHFIRTSRLCQLKSIQGIIFYILNIFQTSIEKIITKKLCNYYENVLFFHKVINDFIYGRDIDFETLT